VAACLAGGACSTGTGGSSADLAFSRDSWETAPRLAFFRRATLCRERANTRACQFGRNAVGAISPQGQVVLGGAGALLEIYDGAGLFLRTIGELGDGPGEYRQVLTVSFDSTRGIAVFDVANFRLTVFDTAGQVTSTRQIRLLPGFAGARASGNRVVWWSVPGSARVRDQVQAAFISEGTTEGDSRPLARTAMPARARLGTDLAPIPPLFAAEPVWDIRPGEEIIFSLGTDFDVDILGPTGSGSSRIRGDVPRIRVTADDLRRETELRYGRPPWPPGMGEQLERARRDAARWLPAITALLALSDDALLVREHEPQGADSARWDYFASPGRLSGYFLLPRSTRLIAGSGHLIMAVSIDSVEGPHAELLAFHDTSSARRP